LLQITTDFSDLKGCSECFALQQFSAGDQVYTERYCGMDGLAATQQLATSP